MADEVESESSSSQTDYKDDKEIKRHNVKEEVFTDDEDQMEIDEEPTLGPAALGLQRVGTTKPKPTPTQPQQVLNARGMPARIRKKNKFFYDDALVNTPHRRVPRKLKITHTKRHRNPTPNTKHTRSPRKMKASNSSMQLQSPDRKIGQKIGMRLRNLLKLPKAHKWVCYEWFYSNIDRCLFSGDNDFSICLKESFPELKSRELTRVEWTKIRRMMGRPRRCSQAFFNQERLELEKKRNKIRALQQRKVADISSFQDLPAEIPMQLVIGTKVTARLRKPQDGLFTGTIGALDTSNNTYRITFERPGLGTHSVPDYEVLSNEPPETMPINNNTPLKPRRNGNPGSYLKSPSKQFLKLHRDPLLSGSMLNKPILPGHGQIGVYPTKLLQRMLLVKKILSAKRLKIKLLKSMNNEAEKYQSLDKDIPEDFERRYAGILIDLEKLNKDLEMFLDEMQQYCQEIAPEPSVAAMLAPSHLREKCQEEAAEIVERCNNSMIMENSSVSNEGVLNLITDLTALMLQVKCLSDSDENAYELKVLEGTMEQIKRKLSPENQIVFQTNVEVHMKHIKAGLGQASSNKQIEIK